MKPFFILIAFLLCSSYVSQAQITALDSSFGVNGIVQLDSPIQMQSNKMALQADHKIILAGCYYYYLPNFDLVYELYTMRFHPDGSLDTSFNGNGIVMHPTYRGTTVSGVSVQADGKIVIAGTEHIERLLPNGQPDYSFCDSGSIQLSFLGPYDRIQDMILQPDGKVLVTGGFHQAYAMVYRLKADGHPDSTFGYNGLVTTTLDSAYSDNGAALTLQPDNKILLAGWTISSPPNYPATFSIVRYLPDGSLDPAFGSGNGYNKIYFPGQMHSRAVNVARQANGKILIGGIVFKPTPTDPNRYWYYSAFTRLDTSGNLDASFGTNGYMLSDTLSNNNNMNLWDEPRIVVQNDDKILLGYADFSAGQNGQFALRRFTPDGSIDNSFGLNGLITTDITVHEDYTTDLLVQPDGNILLSGISDVTDDWPLSLHYLGTMVRYKPNINLGVPDITNNISNLQLFPNPVDNITTLQYDLAATSKISIHLCDVNGRTIQSFYQNQQRSKGNHKETLTLRNDLSTGNYFVVMATENGVRVVKMSKN
ncbi:T9SS type A sorting domain-containing protein [Taibaiella soli]|uniref:Secretion system C-terminal sorting domain-containing protein n=1 Tax=Taibaiella soli TaxID=1649169 RepID=A0A2W2B0N7_9BACT|nr:T9SS type A sorting domain-containing protein [Taibaiella soli]PZF73538.1 hypothetical protein DN068_07375 [Taibaiella soli]